MKQRSYQKTKARKLVKISKTLGFVVHIYNLRTEALRWLNSWEHLLLLWDSQPWVSPVQENPASSCLLRYRNSCTHTPTQRHTHIHINKNNKINKELFLRSWKKQCLHNKTLPTTNVPTSRQKLRCIKRDTYWYDSEHHCLLSFQQ